MAPSESAATALHRAGHRAHQQHLPQAAPDRPHAPPQRAGDGDQRDSLRPRRSRSNVETFAARINSAFYPQPQGARTTITVEEDYPAAFDIFRAIQKRTGKNFAALAGDYHAAMWAAIRAGWRAGYTVGAAESPAESRSGLQPLYRRRSLPPSTGSNDAEKAHQQIRRARAALKISRAFDFELDARSPHDSAKSCAPPWNACRQRGHAPQLVGPGPVADEDLDEMAAIAQHFQITLSFRYRGEPAETVRPSPKPPPAGSTTGFAIAGRSRIRRGATCL